MRDSTTMLRQFTQPKIPEEVRVGYLQFKVKQYFLQPLCCFKCNRYGHVANHCKGKERCSNCGGADSWKNYDSHDKRCPNCKCNHSAANTAFSLYKRESEIVKIKTVCNITYAEACRKQRSIEYQILPDRSSKDEFPPLPAVGFGN